MNASIHMDPAILTRIPYNNRILINSLEFILTGLDLEFLDGNNADEGEERAVWLPAFGTPAGVVVRDIAGEVDFHWIRGAVTD